MAIVSYATTLSLGKIFASKRGFTFSPNQEGLALGAAHLVSSCFACFPGSAALARRFDLLFMKNEIEVTGVNFGYFVRFWKISSVFDLFKINTPIIEIILMVIHLVILERKKWKIFTDRSQLTPGVGRWQHAFGVARERTLHVHYYRLDRANFPNAAPFGVELYCHCQFAIHVSPVSTIAKHVARNTPRLFRFCGFKYKSKVQIKYLN